MNRSVEIDIKGLAQMQRYARALPDIMEDAAVLAVNDTARFAHAESSRRIRSEINFKQGYLGSAESGGSRLRIRKKARGGDPVAIITGRQQATSLAQFVQGEFRKGKPVRVKVSARGGVRGIPGAFPIRLRRGGLAVSEDKFNMGLAIRLGKDETVRNKREMVQLSGNLYLLYGPSVDQVFRTVAEDVQPEVADRLSKNYLRQFARLSKGR